MVVVVFATPTLLYFAINSKYLQNRVVQRVAAMLSETLGNHISVGDIRISRFNMVTINDLLVTDLRGDTVLAVPELIGRLNMFAFRSREIQVRSVVLNRADIRLANDPITDEVNIKFITEKLKSENEPKWNFSILTIELNDCRFLYKNELKAVSDIAPEAMDYSKIDVTGINMVISDFQALGDSLGGVKFRISRLSAAESCGLVIDFMSADFLVNKNNMSFKNIQLSTPHSDLMANEVSFHFDSWQDFSDGNFNSKVHMNMDIQSSHVGFCCLSHFVPYFGIYPGNFRMAGRVTGTVDNLRGGNMDVHFGEITHINGSFDLKGLPNIRTTLIHANVRELITCPKDIELIQVVKLPAGNINLPEAMHQFTSIAFRGNFTGFYDDFVTHGTFATNLGNLSTDLSIRPVIGVDNDTTFYFRGRMATEQFHLGELLIQPAIGKMNMIGTVEGAVSVRGNIHAELDGVINGIDIRGYEYRNIAVNGAINNRAYNGHLSIDEPNIKVDFTGKVDMTDPIPSYDFTAIVERANLYNLNLVRADTSSFVSFNVEAVFSGTNIDNLSGDFDLKNSLIRRNNRELEINDLLVFTKAINDTNRFILRSDIFDAEIWGEYQFLKLPESFFSMVKNFAPAWAPDNISPDSLSHNSFRFDARFKDTQKLTDFFVNEFRVARGTLLEGVYNPAHRDVNFVLHVPYMTLGNMQWRDFYVNAGVEDTVFVFESGSRIFNFNKNMSFENLTVLAQARGDSVGLDIRWNNWDSLLYRGNINSQIFFTQKPNRTVPLMHIRSSPGQLVFANDVWDLTHRGITIDSTSIRIDNIRAVMDNQEIALSGVISKREQDILQVAVKDFDLSVINSSMQFDHLIFGGITNGTASLSNLFDVPVFVSDIQIDGFSLNNSRFGDANLIASWNSTDRSVHIDAKSLLNDLRTMQINGNYFLADQALDFNVFLNEVPIAILQPYLDNIFTGLAGTLSGDMKLTGTIYNPLFNGTLGVNNAALTLDYTRTRYNFSGAANVINNSILFRNFDLFDRFSNLCRITDGFIDFVNFRDIHYELHLQANNLEVLNTNVRDNSMFYGNVFATGNIHIRGAPQDMHLDIHARTERNTHINIPLSSSEELSKTTFIRFVDHSAHNQRRPLELRRRVVAVTPDEPAPEARFAININLDVTPNAEAQLIFDPTVGDIIRARGSGNLNLNITNSRFDIRGTYTIAEGDYMFTLRNLINRRFIIEQGGVITWSGDPLGALLNLRAIYTTRASLFHLMNDENFRRSVPVECILHISNVLTNPNIRFELNMPNVEQEVQSFLRAATSSEEEMAQQFLSLLALNQFFPDPNRQATPMSSGTGLEMGLATASEILTNRFSSMVSQFSGVDFDFRYRPGSVETGSGQNYGIDLSSDWWNFHANYEVNAENGENVGEFLLDFRLGNSNRFRFKVFNRANARYLAQNPYTQGIGLLFRQDFNRIGDLFNRNGQSSAIRREEEDVDTDTDEASDVQRVSLVN